MKQQPETRGISQSEYARRHGWSQSYISKLVSQGKISTLANGRINPAQADIELERNRGYTLHGRNGRSLCAETDWDDVIVHAWNEFFTATEQLWKLVPAKRLSKRLMLEYVRDLK